MQQLLFCLLIFTFIDAIEPLGMSVTTEQSGDVQMLDGKLLFLKYK